MCLIFVASEFHARYPLVVAANRDEFYARPAVPAQFWQDEPDILAGRDLQAGGTWLGITRTGRFAALTNVHGGEAPAPDAPSRGHLVSEFLRGTESPAAYASRISRGAAEYRGFNLLVWERGELIWYSNRGDGVRRLAPGIYGISNDLLDTPWPKVVDGKRRLRELLSGDQPECEAILAMLARRDVPAGGEAPDTGPEGEAPRVLAPMFIRGEHYGTRCSTALTVGAGGGVEFVERSFPPGSAATEVCVRFQLAPRERPVPALY